MSEPPVQRIEPSETTVGPSVDSGSARVWKPSMQVRIQIVTESGNNRKYSFFNEQEVTRYLLNRKRSQYRFFEESAGGRIRTCEALRRGS